MIIPYDKKYDKKLMSNIGYDKYRPRSVSRINEFFFFFYIMQFPFLVDKGIDVINKVYFDLLWIAIIVIYWCIVELEPRKGLFYFMLKTYIFATLVSNQGLKI